MVGLIMLVPGCGGLEPNVLNELGTVRMVLGGQPHELWIANSFDEQLRGLMLVTQEQMAATPNGTERGMIFVFEADQINSFWMKDTVISLDIAYVAADGRVISTYTMTALDERVGQYPPDAPYRYAIELNAGRIDELGLVPGDVLQIPNF